MTVKKTVDMDPDSDWDVKEWAEHGSPTLCGASFPVGVYSLAVSDNCDITFSASSDLLCEGRKAFMEQTFEYKEPECHAPGSSLVGQFASSDLDATFSSKAVHVTFAEDNYIIITAHDIAVFQKWKEVDPTLYDEPEDDNVVSISDVMSIPLGHTCKPELEGIYKNVETQGTGGCGVQRCGLEEACESRGSLWHGAKFNGYKGPVCQKSVGAGSAVNPIFGQCSSGNQWRRDPDECFNQVVAGGCVYCEGIVNDDSFSYCITRDHKNCRTLFEEVGVQTVCNLAYECTDLGFDIGSGSATVASFVLLVSMLALAMF